VNGVIGRDRVVVRAVRDWGHVTIETLYTLAAGSDSIELVTTMHNDGDVVLPDLLSGFVKPEDTSWVSQIVEDREGHETYTDPIWIEAVDRP
jgi:hypothetical protein